MLYWFIFWIIISFLYALIRFSVVYWELKTNKHITIAQEKYDFWGFEKVAKLTPDQVSLMLVTALLPFMYFYLILLIGQIVSEEISKKLRIEE